VKGVTVYLHDWFGPGRHAKVVSTRSPEFKAEEAKYRTEPLVTGDESRLTEIGDVVFPKLLDPVDDLPPATVITHVRIAGDKLLVRGTTTDNGTVKRVLVNGREARAVAANFAEWETILDRVPSSELNLSAYAEDAAGNVEKRPHEWRLQHP
jgi:hypothetical protein